MINVPLPNTTPAQLVEQKIKDAKRDELRRILANNGYFCEWYDLPEPLLRYIESHRQRLIS